MEKDERELFGIKLRILMKQSGLNTRECAYQIGCTERSLQRWLKGEVQPLGVYLKKIKEMFPKLGRLK